MGIPGPHFSGKMAPGSIFYQENGDPAVKSRRAHIVEVSQETQQDIADIV